MGTYRRSPRGHSVLGRLIVLLVLATGDPSAEPYGQTGAGKSTPSKPCPIDGCPGRVRQRASRRWVCNANPTAHNFPPDQFSNQ
jgi:hypothetical protein